MAARGGCLGEGLEGDVEEASGDIPGGEPVGDGPVDDGPTGKGASADADAAADPAERTERAEAVEPTEPTEPTEPAEPAETASVFDSPVPPPALDPVAGVEFTVPDEPPAEAAHARRTMIGRSAEEVDHAPPRGRYAPVPSPDAGGAGTTLRWVAPAAALALASAVLGRALRRRSALAASRVVG
ncbi:Carbon monoxide dehydrogenase subunit G OS=Streptomyces microflavus OX=1919 GN=Smic_36210 PE=4 SV=1 [Streptomyces microflavus]